MKRPHCEMCYCQYPQHSMHESVVLYHSGCERCRGEGWTTRPHSEIRYPGIAPIYGAGYN